MRKAFGNFVFWASKSNWLRQILTNLGLLRFIYFVLHHFPNILPPLPVLERPVQILGEKFPNLTTWNEKLFEINAIPGGATRTREMAPVGFSHQEPVATVIVSLFSSDQYISAFLDNLTSQTMFNHCEVVIVSVQASDSVRSHLKNLEDSHRQIKLIEVTEPMGIYQAWNKAILSSTAPLITNMNADDLRRRDSLEIQVGQLHADASLDIVYQDVFYSLSPNLVWNVIEEMGWKSNLPDVTLRLLATGMNLPHNAPMWRRTLHEHVGLFDTSFLSAGDHDFWIRASICGAKFAKNPTPHVAYYVNPFGMSTKINSPGRNEGLLILSKYKKFGRRGI